MRIFQYSIVFKGVNECESGNPDCHRHAVCIDQPEGYTCVCKPGFTGDGVYCDGRFFSLIKYIPNLSVLFCIVKFLQAQYVWDSNISVSIHSDINECDDMCDFVLAFCTNTVGSFICHCLPGLEMVDDFCQGNPRIGNLL